MDDEQKPKPKSSEADFVIDEKGKLEETEETYPKETVKDESDSRWHRFAGWYKANKKKSVPLTILVLILLLAAIPWSRYHVAGLVLKKDLNLQVIDSTAGTPVSGAQVSLGSLEAITNGTGRATLHNVKVGRHTVLITKKYYKDSKTSILVPILKQKTTPNIKFVATGRQVKISVKNLINHNALADVDIKIADINAKTDKSGNATIVLPVGTQSEKATLSLDGYNNASVTVKASDKTIQENNFTMTPAGKVYFLSKLSGKIDVVKTNLDGSGRQTVLAGTGREDDRNTVLLASRDWKYLALLSHREAGTTKLYLINTSDDSLVTMDGDASTDLTLVGWSGHNFIYTVYRRNVTNWQPNQQALKSYNAGSGKITLLAQTTASGTNNSDYLKQELGQAYVLNGQVVYALGWSAGFSSWPQLNAKQATLNSIKDSGTNNKVIKSFGVDATTQTSDISISTKVYKPDILYVAFSVGSGPHYYSYNYENNQIKEDSSITDDKFWSTNYPTYLQSPSGDQTFWSESRDGKNTLLIGNDEGENSKQVATLSDYQTYGWYTNDYLLVSKNSSELYILPKSPSKDTAAIKITDYHKPEQTFNGYGGGYGGL